MLFSAKTRMPCWKGRVSTVDLLVLTNLDRLLFWWKYYLMCSKASYINEEVNCTEPFPSVSVPWPKLLPCIGDFMKKIVEPFPFPQIPDFRIGREVFRQDGLRHFDGTFRRRRHDQVDGFESGTSWKGFGNTEITISFINFIFSHYNCFHICR